MTKRQYERYLQCGGCRQWGKCLSRQEGQFLGRDCNQRGGSRVPRIGTIYMGEKEAGA